MRERDKNRKLFHRGHHEVIAARFRGQLSQYPNESVDELVIRNALADLAIALAKRFQFDNEDFDPRMFLERCSLNPDAYNLADLWEE